jgi:hypothetical protein
MAPPPTKCIFCASIGPLTNEHIFPKWAHRYLSRMTTKYRKLVATSLPDRSDYRILKRPGDLLDWQVKCVCGAKCNNGWMRRLVEDRARPILVHLVKGDAIRITPEQQQLIATWACLKAMISEHDFSDYVTTHHVQRTRMMLRQMPPKKAWAVWIGHFEWKRSPIRWSTVPLLLINKETASLRSGDPATYYNGHVTTQIIGKLFIQIIRAPTSFHSVVARWRFAPPDGGTLFRIWPPSTISIAWPGAMLTERDAVYADEAFKRFLEDVFRLSRQKLDVSNVSRLVALGAGKRTR